MESDRSSFHQCKTERRLIIYRCHAGLIEAVVPLIDNHIVIGYLMFGQISDASDLDELKYPDSPFGAGPETVKRIRSVNHTDF